MNCLDSSEFNVASDCPLPLTTAWVFIQPGTCVKVTSDLKVELRQWFSPISS